MCAWWFRVLEGGRSDGDGDEAETEIARLGGGPGIFHRVRSFVRSRSSALDRRQSVYRDRSTPGTFHHRERAGWCAPEFALYAATGSLFSGRNFLS
jgi:hypothetical protein